MTAESFADVLRERTARQHRLAERSGVIHEILAGRVRRGAYSLFLRNLLPAYRALEDALDVHRARTGSAGVGALHLTPLLRAGAIERDLVALVGERWVDTLPLLPQGEHYAARVSLAAEGDGARLVAHAYTRYLGDLAGGRVLGRRLHATLGLDPSALSFYAFPGIDDVPSFTRGFRSTIDALGAALSDSEPVIAEAELAFTLNIDVSEAVARAEQSRTR